MLILPESSSLPADLRSCVRRYSKRPYPDFGRLSSPRVTSSPTASRHALEFEMIVPCMVLFEVRRKRVVLICLPVFLGSARLSERI